MKPFQRIYEKSISLEEIPNLLPVTKVTPKGNKENIQVTQVHSLMDGKKILKRFHQSRETKPKRSKQRKEIQATIVN